jgi:Uncharacterized protein conserved in bacteria
MRKIILTTIALLLLSSVGYGADWKFFGTGARESLWYYDAQNISRGQDKVMVRTKHVLSDKKRADFINNFHNINGIENTSYTIDKYEFDCSKNRIKLISLKFYSSEGNLIYSEDYHDLQFIDVIPNSIGDLLSKVICKEGEGEKSLVLGAPALGLAEMKKEYYPSGKLHFERNYKDGKLEGISKRYYEGGKLWSEANCSNGKLEGITKNYFESGKLDFERNYKDGKQEGISRGYYKSGKLWSEANFSNGKLEGITKDYLKAVNCI